MQGIGHKAAGLCATAWHSSRQKIKCIAHAPQVSGLSSKTPLK